MQAMFASDRECGAVIDDPNLLVTLFDLPSSQLQRSDPKQLGVTLLFYHPSHSQSGPSMETPDVRECAKKLEKLAGGLFSKLPNANNIFVAGGAALAALTNNTCTVFLVGPTQAEAMKKAFEIIETIRQENPRATCIVSRSKRCLTIHREYEQTDVALKPVQIILRLYRCKTEVLIDFDLDACLPSSRI